MNLVLDFRILYRWPLEAEDGVGRGVKFKNNF